VRKENKIASSFGDSLFSNLLWQPVKRPIISHQVTDHITPRTGASITGRLIVPSRYPLSRGIGIYTNSRTDFTLPLGGSSDSEGRAEDAQAMTAIPGDAKNYQNSEENISLNCWQFVDFWGICCILTIASTASS